MTTHKHIIDRGPFKGMVETLTNNPHPAKTERCWNYTQAAQSGPRITKILAYLIFWCGLVTAGGTFLFLIFLLLKNLF